MGGSLFGSQFLELACHLLQSWDPRTQNLLVEQSWYSVCKKTDRAGDSSQAILALEHALSPGKTWAVGRTWQL